MCISADMRACFVRVCENFFLFFARATRDTSAHTHTHTHTHANMQSDAPNNSPTERREERPQAGGIRQCHTGAQDLHLTPSLSLSYTLYPPCAITNTLLTPNIRHVPSLVLSRARSLSLISFPPLFLMFCLNFCKSLAQ